MISLCPNFNDYIDGGAGRRLGFPAKAGMIQSDGGAGIDTIYGGAGADTFNGWEWSSGEVKDYNILGRRYPCLVMPFTRQELSEALVSFQQEYSVLTQTPHSPPVLVMGGFFLFRRWFRQVSRQLAVGRGIGVEERL